VLYDDPGGDGDLVMQMASINFEDENLVKVTDFGESRAVATAYAGRDRLQNPGPYCPSPFPIPPLDPKVLTVM
jgi:hypothetical protein